MQRVAQFLSALNTGYLLQQMAQYYELIDGGEHNPYHFLFYMVPNFISLDQSREIIYYYPNKKNDKISEGFLALLPANYTRQLMKQPGIEYRMFYNIFPTFQDFTLPVLYKFVRQLFIQSVAPQQIKGRKIYIQRKAPFGRTFSNDADLQPLLERFGYEAVILENLSVKDQVRVVSEAEYVIGGHGAGLSFVVFCHPGTKLIEITARKNSEIRHYYHMATSMGYRYLRFQDVVDTGNDTWNVDLQVLERTLAEWHHPQIFLD